MASRAKDARAARSGAALRQAMLKLLPCKPFDQITVRDICAEAAVHYATFFRHHEGKEALLDEIAAEQIDMLVDLTLPVMKTAGQAIAIERLFIYIADHRALWSILLNGGASSAMRSEWLARAQEVSETYKGPHGWMPTELGVTASVAIIFETVTWWLRQPEGEYTTDHAAEILSRLLAPFIPSSTQSGPK